MAIKTSDVIKLPGARLSYAKLFKPEAFQGDGDSVGEKKFQATFLLDPSNADHAAKIKEIKQAAGKLMKEAYGADFKSTGLKGVCFGDGNKKVNEKGEVKEGYENMFFVTVSNTVRPAIANRAGQPVAEGDPQVPYSGCYVLGSITLWAQNNKFGKRINGNLRGVQFMKDGPAFGAGPVRVEDEFEALEDGAATVTGGTEELDDLEF